MVGSGAKLLIDCGPDEAKAHFLKGSSYFNSDLPEYISFEPVIKKVDALLKDSDYSGHKNDKYPAELDGVNYKLLNNKDGRFAWRQYELIHPVLYVSLVNAICTTNNWQHITARLSSFGSGAVRCCSAPVLSTDHQSDKAAQIRSWWHQLEQETIKLAMDFTHIVHTDVTDCYGSIYTHGISWALHTKDVAKKSKNDKALVGNIIDRHIQAGRHGQTNGIAQGSVLMDFVAELVLGFVDDRITELVGEPKDFRILRYRDDYRILTHSDRRAEELLMKVSSALWSVGMRLGVSKTHVSTSIVESAVKPDKMAGIAYEDFGEINDVSLQKKLLNLHSFGRKFPNSGALRRLISKLQHKIYSQMSAPQDLDVQISILTDIAIGSPVTFPVVASILSHLISLKADKVEKARVWDAISKKLQVVHNNGYLEIWLQRVTKPKAVDVSFESSEAICKVVDGKEVTLWDNSWIANKDLLAAINKPEIVVSDPSDMPEVMDLKETKLFHESAYHY